MLQTHSLSLLLPQIHDTNLFRRISWIDGIVAPSFILAAGFSLALVQVRGAAAGARRKRFFKSLKRIIEVNVVAVGMAWVWFPIFYEPKWLLRIDILNCIGLTLLAALPFFAWLAKRPWVLAASSFAIGVALLMATAFATTVSGTLGHFLNNASGSMFPLLPWSAYVFVGGALGAIAAACSRKTLALALCGTLLLGCVLEPISLRLMAAFPDLGFSFAANHSNRLIVVSLIALALLGIEQRIPQRLSHCAAVRFVEVFGTSSLAAYFLHEVLLFKGLFGINYYAFFGKQVDWPLFWVLTTSLVALTFVLILPLDYLKAQALRLIGMALDFVRGRRRQIALEGQGQIEAEAVGAVAASHQEPSAAASR
jgi:uncharacterized membrane protein